MRIREIWVFNTSVILVLMATLSLATAVAQEDEMTNSQLDSREVMTSILRIERQVMEAIKIKDVGTLREFLSDDFIHRSPGQADSDKEAFLNGISSIPFQIVDISGEGLKVSVYGSVAVLTGIQRATVKGEDGENVASVNAFTDVFKICEDKWKMVLAYSVDMNSP